tara:strand:+ start:414 stop:728 length:315 start_codon:yes stop_codon:yes gene_type:complete
MALDIDFVAGQHAIGKIATVLRKCSDEQRELLVDNLILIANQLEEGFKEPIKENYVKKRLKTPKEIYEELMRLAHNLEDKLQYDETVKGKEWGELVNKLQKFKL